MLAPSRGYAETAEGLDLLYPPAAGIPWGCIVPAAVAGLGPGIWCLTTGAVAPGVALITVGLSLAVVGGAMPTPTRLFVTRDALRLGRRSLYRVDELEIPRSCWKDLWLVSFDGERNGVFLLTSPPDGRKTTYAIPVSSGSNDVTRQVADRIGEWHRLPWRSAVVAPPPPPKLGSLRESAAEGVAEYQRVKGQMRPAVAAADPDSTSPETRAAVRQVARATAILKGFGALENPEAWLIDSETATLTRLASDGSRTPYAFAEVAAVAVEAELFNEERGSDSDTEYANRYAVYLVLASGPRFLLHRCGSAEPWKTALSGAERGALQFADYLRKSLGLATG